MMKNGICYILAIMIGAVGLCVAINNNNLIIVYLAGALQMIVLLAGCKMMGN